jgi:hypothetical protein
METNTNRSGVTMTLTANEWRDIRDTLTAQHQNRTIAMRTDPLPLAMAISTKLSLATDNPMD